MDQFTPGPWAYWPDGPEFLAPEDRSPNYRAVSAGDGFFDDLSGVGFGLSGYFSAADGALIAAAPELFAALTKLSNEVLGSLPLVSASVRQEIGNTNYSILIQRAEEARAALAKAAP